MRITKYFAIERCPARWADMAIEYLPYFLEMA